MGARPIALLDGLRFGAPDWHFRRAVAGIGHYGNCVGVAERRRRDGLRRRVRREPARERDVRRAARRPSGVLRGEGDGHRERVVVLYGALTGRDGIGGASVLASQDLEGARREAAVRADRRPVPRQGADRGLARARRARARRSGCRTAAPPGSPPRSPRWPPTAPASTSTSTVYRCASPTSSRGRS